MCQSLRSGISVSALDRSVLSSNCNVGHTGFNQADVFVIFGGSNIRGIAAFCRVLDRDGLPFVIIARGPQDSLHKTRYRDHIAAVRKKDALDWLDIRRCLRRVRAAGGYGRVVVCPSSEALNLFLLHHRKDLHREGCVLPLVTADLYRTISDKFSFQRLCARHSLCVPRVYRQDGEIRFPCVAKPRVNAAGDRILYPVILNSRSALHEFSACHDMADYFLQQYIDGASFYLLYCICSDGSSRSYSQQNLLQQAGGKSIVLAYGSDIHTQGIGRDYRDLLVRIGFTGIIMIEVKHDRDRYYLIEANPRLWGPAQLCVDAGSHVLESFISQYLPGGSKSHDDRSAEKVRYFWLGGVLENVFAHAKLIRHRGDQPLGLLEYLRCSARDVFLRPDTLWLFLDSVRNKSGGDVK